MKLDKQTEMDWENLLEKCTSEMDQAISEHIPALPSVVNQVPEASHSPNLINQQKSSVR